MVGNRRNRQNVAAPWWMGYVITVIAELALAAGLMLLHPILPIAEYPAPYVLVMTMAAYFFGAGPAIVAFLLGFVLYAYASPPYHGIWPPAASPKEWAGLVALLVGSSIVGFAVVLMRTSRHRAELLAAELQRANMHTTETLESIAECYFALDSDLRVADVNRVAEQSMFARLHDELLGRALLEDYPQLQGSEFERQCRSALVAQSQLHFEDRLWFQERWFECHVFPYDTCLEVYLRDITDRKQAEEAVRDSEARYRSLIETMNEGFCVTDADYVFTYVNPRYTEMIGYPQEEIVGHHLADFLSEQSRERLAEHIAERKTGHYSQYELTWVSRAGRSVHTLVSPRPVFDRDGSFAGSYAAVTDITELKLSEDALRESERRYRQLFHGANDAIFLVDAAKRDLPGRFIDVNNVACERLGYTREDLLRMGPVDIDTPESVARQSVMMKQVQEQGYCTFEIVQLTKDGREIPTELSAHYFQLGDSDVILAIARDISERKEAQERLLRSEERFRSLFERAADSLFLHDLQGGFVEANEAACKTLGYTRDELLELSVQDLVTDYDQAALDDLWANLSVSPQTVYATHRRKDGSMLSVEGRLSLLEYGGEVLVLAVVRDITERKRAEEERRALEEHVEQQKRSFYRETIFSVTGGILDICDDRDIAPYISSTQMKIDVESPAQSSTARRAVEAFLTECGLVGDRLDLFITGVGEAITNAIKHGNKGTVYAGCEDGTVWVGIADNGPGIESLILPRAVLLRGFSTKPSLGLGYCVMLEVADRIHLKTDDRGTVVILEKSLAEDSGLPSLDSLPDTWAQILADGLV